jgi:hypothetical protein
MANHVILNAVIPINTALSQEIDLNGLTVIGVEMPAEWTAAVLTFQGGSTYGALGNVFDIYGNELRLLVVAGGMHPLESVLELLAWRYLRVHSGYAASPVNQMAERTVKLVCRPF